MKFKVKSKNNSFDTFFKEMDKRFNLSEKIYVGFNEECEEIFKKLLRVRKPESVKECTEKLSKTLKFYLGSDNLGKMYDNLNDYNHILWLEVCARYGLCKLND